MSKIYEALIRAEQERAAEERERAEAGASASASDWAAVSTPEHTAAPWPAFEAPAPFEHAQAFPAPHAYEAPPAYEPPHTYEPPQAYEAPQEYQAPHPFASQPDPFAPPSFPFDQPEVHTQPVAAATSSLDSVRTAVWHPQFNRLPALQPRGNQVEQFRSLRSKLFEFRDLNTLKSVLVSSGIPAEGKSFVAANLAVTFSRHKSARVLLIDCDLRRSTQYKMLGAPNDPGLAEYLAGKASLTEVMQRGKPEREGAVLPVGLSSLTFIPAGEAGDRAADLAGSQRFVDLIQAVNPHFDWIIVDSSPVNLVTDGANLARACDGVLLIARGGVTKFETAQRAISELKASKILGLVLNGVENPPVADGYYGYDNYDSLTD